MQDYNEKQNGRRHQRPCSNHVVKELGASYTNHLSKNSVVAAILTLRILQECMMHKSWLEKEDGNDTNFITLKMDVSR